MIVIIVSSRQNVNQQKFNACFKNLKDRNNDKNQGEIESTRFNIYNNKHVLHKM